MALIAATAVGLAFVRYSQTRFFVWEEPAVADRLVYHTLYQTGQVVYWILPVLYGLCAAVVATVLRGKRPWREEICHRPGPAACAAALVAMLAALVFHVLDYAVGKFPGVLWSAHDDLFGSPALDRLVANRPSALDRLVAMAYDAFGSPRTVAWLFAAAGDGAIPTILVVWMLQLLCGLWNPVPEWPDRLGRILGLIFLLWMLTPH
jgi:hypothetical protein